MSADEVPAAGARRGPAMTCIPDPTQPESVAIAPDGGIVYGVRIGPARMDGSAPTKADLEAMVHIGWSNGAGPALDETPSFVCPKCGARSFNPNDVRERYCGRCHEWADE